MGEGDVVQCNGISMHGGEHYQLSRYEHITEGQAGPGWSLIIFFNFL